MAPIHGPEFMAILKTQILHESLCACVLGDIGRRDVVEGSATAENATRVSINLGATVVPFVCSAEFCAVAK